MLVLSEEQERARQIVLRTEDNLFITGLPGTGKTILLEQIIRNLRAMGRVVRASAFTGLAAQRLGGITLARLLGLGLAKRVGEIRNVCAAHAIAEKNLTGVTDLVIDEISMVSGDYLRLISVMVGDVLCRPRVPFGGIRVVFCGDFLQLPPIRDKGDAPFEVRWAFQRPEFSRVKTIQLTENHRQSREEDLRILEEIRTGRPGKAAQEFVHQAANRKVKGATELHPRNNKVQAINQNRLEALIGAAEKYRTEFNGDKGFILPHLPIGEEVAFKIGAPVICRANCPKRGYFNGTQGQVLGLDEKAVWIRVLDEEPGKNIRKVVPHEWRIEMQEGGQVTQVLTARGIPLTLGWASTIHKAQGMTLKRIHADLSECWEPGHTYVALSRATNLDNVSLASPKVRMRTDLEALAFTKSLTRI